MRWLVGLFLKACWRRFSLYGQHSTIQPPHVWVNNHLFDRCSHGDRLSLSSCESSATFRVRICWSSSVIRRQLGVWWSRMSTRGQCIHVQTPLCLVLIQLFGGWWVFVNRRQYLAHYNELWTDFASCVLTDLSDHDLSDIILQHVVSVVIIVWKSFELNYWCRRLWRTAVARMMTVIFVTSPHQRSKGPLRPKLNPVLIGQTSSKLATWSLLKRKISFTAACRGLHVGGIMMDGSKRLHSLSSASEPAPPKMENTYRLYPDDKASFRPLSVQKEIADVLEGVLGNMEYNPSTSGRITTRLSEAIKVRVKALQFTRHKLVVHVLVGSHSGQCLELASRCLWNQETDSYATASYQNSSLFAIASVYGIYFE